MNPGWAIFAALLGVTFGLGALHAALGRTNALLLRIARAIEEKRR